MTSSSLRNSISGVLNQSISQIQKSTPLAVGILLSSAALLPTIQAAPAQLAASLAIGGTLLSGLGTNLMTDLIKERLYKIAGKKDEEILKETEKALLDLWNAEGKKGEDFRKELSAFLQRNGILQMAMDGAPQEMKNALLNSFAELAEKFDEFNWALKYIQESLAEISATGRQQVEASNEILAKVNMLLQMQRENQKKASLPLEPKQGEEDQPRTEIENPYKGLAFFTQADGNAYFGREELTAQLLAKLAGSPFLALLGASGSGKSSLMRAGVIWALYAGGIPGSENWKVLVMRPGATPLEDLAAQVSAESRSVSSSLMRELKNDPSALRLEAKKILLNLPDDAKLVLAVDQFEEVFTQCQDENERGQFIATLTDAAQHSNSRIVVLLTLRADYYGRCSAYPALAKLLSENQVLVGEMTDAELRRAISAPAENVGVRVEAGLPELIIEEARGEKGALPMISLALAELFKNRKTDTLKVAEYRELGGLNQVIATTADKAYLSLSQAEQTLARKILLDLVKTGETAEQDARQRVRPSTLASGYKNRIQVEELLNKLADARLIVKDGESEDAQVEVSHEALFRHWDKLRDWLEEAREEKNLRQKISEAANEWIKNNKDANLLVHRGGRLDDALKLDDLNPTDLEYIKAGDALRRKEQRDREKRTRITVFASIAAAVVFLVLGAFGLVKSNEAEVNAQIAGDNAATAQANANAAATAQSNAEEQARIALARQLSAQAEVLYRDHSSNQMLSSLLAIQSLKILPNGDAARFLINNNHSALLIKQMWYYGHVNSIAFSPDGKYIVSGSTNNPKVSVWDMKTGEKVARINLINDVQSVAFSPDGKYVFLGTDKIVIVWDVQVGVEILRIDIGDDNELVVFSLDGKYIASAVAEKVFVWSLQTGNLVTQVTHGEKNVNSVAFSPDSKFVVTGGGDDTARVWDVQTGVEVIRVTHDVERVGSVVFSPDGKFFATTGAYFGEGTARVWDAQTGVEVAHVTNYQSELIAFSPDSQFLASAKGNIVGVLDIHSGEEVVNVQIDLDGVTSLAFSPDSKFIVLAGGDGTARVLDLKTGTEIAHLTHDDFVGTAAFSPDGKYVASGSWDGTVRIWDVQLELAQAQMRHDSTATSAAWSPDGKNIVSGGWDNTVRIWDVQTSEEVIRMKHDDRVESVSYSSDGKYVASGSSDNTARVWDAKTGIEVARETFDDWVNFVSFSSDGKYIVSGGYDDVVRVWEAQTGALVSQRNYSNIDNAIAFSSNGKYIVTGNWDGTTQVWDTNTGEVVIQENDSDSVKFVAFSPDTRYILSAGNNFIRIWDIQDGRTVSRMTHDDLVSSVAFSPNGKYIISGSSDGTARVWDVQTGVEVARMNHDDLVTSVAFSSDGKYVVSGGADSSARIWDAKTGVEVARMVHIGFITSVVFSPNSDYVVSSSGDGTVRIWLWRFEDIITDACFRASRNLTRSEWDQYIGAALPYQAVCPNLPIEE